MDHLSYCDSPPPRAAPLQKHNMELSYCPGIDSRLSEEAALASPVRSFAGILKEKANFIKNTISTRHSSGAAFRRSKHDLKPAVCSVGQSDGTNQWSLTSSWGKMFFFICVGVVVICWTSQITFIMQQLLQRAHKNVRWQTLCYFLWGFFWRKLDLFFYYRVRFAVRLIHEKNPLSLFHHSVFNSQRAGRSFLCLWLL